MPVMDWAQTWTIIGVLGSLILGVGGIAITVLIGMRSENRTAHEQINKRIDDGLAGVHKRIDDGNAALQSRIDDLRELVLTLVRGASTRSDTEQESAP